MTLTPADADLERAIELAALRLQFAKTRRDQVKAWDELTALHAKRSDEQVRHMEHAQGLRR